MNDTVLLMGGGGYQTYKVLFDPKYCSQGHPNCYQTYFSLIWDDCDVLSYLCAYPITDSKFGVTN